MADNFEDFLALTRQNTRKQSAYSRAAVNSYTSPECDEFTQQKILELQKLCHDIETRMAQPSLGSLEDLKDRRILYCSELNKTQQQAVVNCEGPLLIIAGAGTGKTRTLSYRVAYMLEKGIDPQNILLLTFTRKAAKEMLARTEELLQNSPVAKITGGTFHAFANMVLRQYSGLLQIEPNFSILDTVDSEDVIDLVRRELKLEKKDRAFPRKKLIHKVLSRARCTEQAISSVLEAEYKSIHEFADDFALIHKTYQRYNEAHKQFDYDDLLEKLYISLCENAHFLEKIQQRYRYIMVDEFQDTNIIQKRIVDKLAEKHRNVMVVGDDSQSIYAFRGANYENILRFPQQYPDCKLVKLEENYRSNADILNFTNDIVNNFILGYKKRLFSSRTQPSIPLARKFYDAEEEAAWIVSQVRQFREQGLELSDMAVLYRSSYHSNFIQAELLKQGLSFVVFGGIRFTERRHVKDIIAYLRLVQNPFDAVSWNRVLKLIPGVGNVTAGKLIREILKQQGKICVEAHRKAKYADELLRLSHALSFCIDDGLKPFEQLAMMKEFYTPVLKAMESDYAVRLLDIDVLLTLSEKYQSLESFLSDFALDPPSNKFQDRQQPVLDENDEKQLVLSTIHSAKGLEWRVVFVPFLLDGLFPSNQALKNIESLDEERRLFYVACTRAKDRLFLSLPSYVPSYDGNFTRMSRFLAELKPTLYEYM